MTKDEMEAYDRDCVSFKNMIMYDFTLSYDTGDSDDTERFISKAEKVFEEYNVGDVSTEIIDDVGSEEPDETPWTVVDFTFDVSDVEVQIMDKILDAIDRI